MNHLDFGKLESIGHKKDLRINESKIGREVFDLCCDIQGLCPICGATIDVTDVTKDGRLIGTCGDAFLVRQWVEGTELEYLIKK